MSLLQFLREFLPPESPLPLWHLQSEVTPPPPPPPPCEASTPAICFSARMSSALRHSPSTQIFSLALKTRANTSPIPFAASANQRVRREKRLLQKLAAKLSDCGVVEAVVEDSVSRLRSTS